MLDMILEVLRASEADAWEVTDERVHGWEMYMIRHRMDQNRTRRVRHVNVKVYRKSADGKYLGSAGAEIPPTATREEAEKQVERLCTYAGYVRNPMYALNRPDGEGRVEARGGDVQVHDMMRDFLETMRAVPESAEADLNSYEIFTEEVRLRYVNSEGVDVESVHPRSMVEAVVNARRDGHEIELYRMYHSGSCDREGLCRSLEETMRFGVDRLDASALPEGGKMPVVFSTDAAIQIYRWFIERMNVAMQYRKISDWTPGTPVSEDMRGDRLTVEAVLSLPNSSCNGEFDAEGARIRPMVLIRDGVAGEVWGSRQFCQYLGIEKGCMPGNFAVSGGTCSAEDLRRGPCLEVVEFSDFQVNSMNGDIAGEIRLGYYHDGEKTVPVTGGSVSGSMKDFVRDMHASREQRQYDRFLIPSVTRLEQVTVAI